MKQKDITMKAVLYCRVSSKEQEDSGYSLDSQSKLLKSYAEKKSFKIKKQFSISESASGKKRRITFKEMMVYVKKNNIKIIICEKVDRLTRNFKDSVIIDEWLNGDEERQLHLVKDSLILHKNSRSQEKLNWGIRIIFAKNYIDNLSEEVRKGQKEKIAQGGLPTKPPVGYKTIGEKGRKIHIIDESKAPLVIKMFELYATGTYSIKKLTDQISNDGLTNNNGNKIVKSRIHKLLTDPFYIGKIRWNGIIYNNGKQKPLISKNLFNKVQAMLKRKSTPKYNKHFYLFKGLIKCKECNGTITWEKQKDHIYGHCNHYKNCSQKNWSKESEVEKQLLKGFKALQIKNPKIIDWVRKALKDSHKDEAEYHMNSLDELQKKYARLQKRLDRIYDDKLDDKITESTYDRKFKQFTDEKEVVTNAIAQHSKASNNYFQFGINIYELAQKAPQIYHKAKKEYRRELINLIFDDLLLNEGNLSFTYSKPFQILLRVVELTNKSSKVLKIDKIESQTFELLKKTDKSNKKDVLQPLHPTLLPG